MTKEDLSVSSRSYAKNAIVLGLLSAVGPFAIDMYLPALPAISSDLKASTASTQATLMVFFLSFGICQIFYGPLSDMVGRKPPLYFGLTLFIIGSIGCAFAPNIHWLIAMRVVQGLGAAAPMVIPRAIIRDLHTGHEATRLMSLVMLVFSVSPILAPLTGSALIVPFGWRAVFFAVAVAAVLAFALILSSLPETRPPHQRIKASVGSVLRGFRGLLTNLRFLGLVFIGACGMSSFFSFLANSSFVYIDHFGLTPTQYSFCFSLNAFGFIGASQFAATLGKRFGAAQVVMGATAIYAFFIVTLFGLMVSGIDTLAVMMAFLFLGFSFLGLVIPSTMVLALEDHGPIAGIAASLAGTLQMVTGGVVIAISSLFFNGTALPMVAIIAISACCALILSLATLWRRAGAAPQLAE
ncbi:MAG: multidrug effflux MFS transporter [Xanthobacteraceae bacterium]|nr:multidrug effflux MFS transporter [Xanthobacteraceae bacterium]